MLWSVVSFLTDAECADQDQVTNWTDPETSETTDNISGEYIFPDNQWMSSTIHEPKEWSVFGQPIRTNNDLKQWHHALNQRAGRSHLPFYELVKLLHNEARVRKLSM